MDIKATSCIPSSCRLRLLSPDGAERWLISTLGEPRQRCAQPLACPVLKWVVRPRHRWSLAGVFAACAVEASRMALDHHEFARRRFITWGRLRLRHALQKGVRRSLIMPSSTSAKHSSASFMIQLHAHWLSPDQRVAWAGKGQPQEPKTAAAAVHRD